MLTSLNTESADAAPCIYVGAIATSRPCHMLALAQISPSPELIVQSCTTLSRSPGAARSLNISGAHESLEQESTLAMKTWSPSEPFLHSRALPRKIPRLGTCQRWHALHQPYLRTTPLIKTWKAAKEQVYTPIAPASVIGLSNLTGTDNRNLGLAQ